MSYENILKWVIWGKIVKPVDMYDVCKILNVWFVADMLLYEIKRFEIINQNTKQNCFKKAVVCCQNLHLMFECSYSKSCIEC